MSAEKTPTSNSGHDTSLRNFVVGLLAVSAVVVVVMYLIESAAG